MQEDPPDPPAAVRRRPLQCRPCGAGERRARHDFRLRARPVARAQAEHALGCVVRLVRCLLGVTAIASKKVEHGLPLVVLGLLVTAGRLHLARPPRRGALIDVAGLTWRILGTPVPREEREVAGADPRGHSRRLSLPRRVRASALDLACQKHWRCRAGAASKLAGALSWAATHQFRRMGRAMLRPIFAHSQGSDARLTADLRSALLWWEEVLARDVSEKRPWRGAADKPVVVLSDARGDPARIAAVVAIDGRLEYTDLAPPAAIVQQFAPRCATTHPFRRLTRHCARLLFGRRDAQIAGLEMLSVALALGTWGERMRGRAVRIFSDNTVAEWAFRRGSAAAIDHAAIVHQFWLSVCCLGLQVRIDRVPTGAGCRRLHFGRCVALTLPRRARRQPGRPPEPGGVCLAATVAGMQGAAPIAGGVPLPAAATPARPYFGLSERSRAHLLTHAARASLQQLER